MCPAQKYNLWNGCQVVHPSPVSDSDSEAIYNQLSALMPAIETGLGMLQAKKPAFVNLLLQLLTILGHPQAVIHHGLVGVQLNFSLLKLTFIAIALVSRFDSLP